MPQPLEDSGPGTPGPPGMRGPMGMTGPPGEYFDKIKKPRLQSTKIAQVKEERPESVVQKEGEECRGNLAPLEAPEDKACREGRGSQESLGNLADL